VSAHVVEVAHALTPVQEGMLFHCLAEPAPELYAIQQRVEIDGSLDVDAFRRAWETVTARHGALRSAFSWQGPGPPKQLVCADVDVEFVVEDLTEMDDAASVVDERFDADLARGFRLDRPPLMRLTLFRLADRRHVLCWNQHHLLEDGWSSALVLSEVFDTYAELAGGGEPVSDPAPQFVDFAEWLATEVDAEEEARFWRDRLAGLERPTRMTVPGGGAGGTRRTEVVERDLGIDGTASVQGLAKASRSTTNAVLVAGLSIAMARYLGHDDVVLGVVASGRPPTLEGVESMVGVFINTLPFRLTVDEAAPVREWVRHVQTRQAELLGHQHVGLATIEEWSALPPNTPLTDTLFAFWDFGGSGETPSGEVRYRTTDGRGRTGFPLDIGVEAGETLRVTVDHDPDRIDGTSVAGFLEQFAAVLEAMAEDPGRPVGDLAVVEAGRESWLDDYNDTSIGLAFGSVLEGFGRQVAAMPSAVAVGFGDRVVSFEELDRLSSKLASTLVDRLPAAGSPVAVRIPRSPALIVALLAVWKAGSPFVPIDRHLPPARARRMVEDSGAELLLDDLAAAADADPLDASVQRMSVRLEDLVGQPERDIDPPDPDDVAYIIYTSGSTGEPKGVVVGHRSLANYAAWAAAAHGEGRPTSYPLFNSIGFDGTLASIIVPLVSGGTIVVYPDDDPLDPVVRDVFEDDLVDVVDLTPSHLGLLDDEHLRTSRIRRLVLGAEELSVAVARRAHDASGGRLAVYNEYGPTEATVACLSWEFNPRSDTGASVPLGTPIDNVRVHLLDAGMRPVPVGVPGEIHVAGVGVAEGYLGRPEATAERFVSDPFVPGGRMYRTGDRARWVAPGVLEFLGRTDDQVKVRGVRIELGEVEAALESHPAITAAAVAVREPRPGDARLVGYFVPSPTRQVNVTDVRRHLRERLPEHMVTRHLVRLDALPLTPNGKLDRDRLPVGIGDVESSGSHVSPRTPAESLVAESVAALLDIDRPGMTENFFDLGGHSLLAMRLVAALASETGVRVSPRLVLLDTLERVADALGPVGTSPEDGASPKRASTGGRSSIGSSAILFGAPDRPLFGIHQAPEGDVPASGPVLICPPVGWDYMRTHWALRRVARSLAAEGHPVLRFDFSGTGDSFGDVGEDAVARWIDDVGTAAAELADAAGSATVSVVGVRLGGTLAVLAARGGAPIDRLVLWDPVLVGADHLDTLRRMHGEMLAGRGIDRPPSRLVGDELLGFPYPEGVRAELAAIDLRSVSWPGVRTTLIASSDRPEERALADSAALDHLVVPDAGTWDDLAAVHAQLLPTAIPAAIVSTLGPEST
jgi:amino acid adenylation domain-containing protein